MARNLKISPLAVFSLFPAWRQREILSGLGDALQYGLIPGSALTGEQSGKVISRTSPHEYTYRGGGANAAVERTPTTMDVE